MRTGSALALIRLSPWPAVTLRTAARPLANPQSSRGRMTRPAGSARWLALAALLAYSPGCHDSPRLESGPVAVVEGATRDDWFKLYLSRQLAGYLRVAAQPRREGGFFVTVLQKLVLKRENTVQENEISSVVEEDAEGKILGFRLRQVLSAEPRVCEARREGDALLVRDVGASRAGETALPVPAGAVGPARLEVMLRDWLKAPGQPLEVVVLVPEMLRFGKARYVFDREEEVEVAGTRRRLRRVTSTVDILPEIRTAEWLDPDGKLQKSAVPLLGMELVSVRSTMEEVLREKLTQPPEVFLATSIPLRGKLPPHARSATYRLQPRTQGAPLADLPGLFATAGQVAEPAKNPGERLLRVERLPAPPATPLGAGPADPALGEYLRAAALIQSDDPAIVAAAKAALGGETDAWKAAQRLESWVHGYIGRKDLATGFASAREVLERKEGDCTEHAVLLAALLRAVGIPSRVVAGLVLYNGSFAGHMWTEAHVGGWLPLDATRAEGGVGPDHIGLAASSLQAASVADLALAIVPVIGSVQIEVVESAP